MPKLLTSACLLRMIRNGEIVVVQGLCFPVSKLISCLSCVPRITKTQGFSSPRKFSYGRRFPWSSYPSMRYIDLHIEWFSLCIVCFPRSTLCPSAFNSHMAAFYWCHVALQLWRYYLRMLNHTFVEISFPQVHFHQGRFSPVSPSPVRHGGFVCRFLQSLLRLSRMGEIDCLFYLFLCS